MAFLSVSVGRAIDRGVVTPHCIGRVPPMADMVVKGTAKLCCGVSGCWRSSFDFGEKLNVGPEED